MGFKEIGIFVGVLALWIVLNRWVLPYFGVSTCMSGACSTPSSYSQVEKPSCCATGSDETAQPAAEPESEPAAKP